ncbi:MAG: hypothetical protein QME74_05990, partial [Candidatus Edwardsbacteria bacterium]|nr:hypothetical protein [Candidatus Edwardsbacteria bacterium]
MRKIVVFTLLAALLPLQAMAVKTAPPKTLTLDFKDADVRDVLRAIGTQFKLNIVVDQNVTGNVTIHLDSAPVLEGLRIFLESNGFSLEQKGAIYYVKKRDLNKFMNVKVESGRITLDVRSADMHELLREISKQGAVNIVADNTVRGDISGLLYAVPLEVGLSSLLSANGFLLRKKQGIYEVTKAGGDPGRRKSMAVSVNKPDVPDTAQIGSDYLLTIDVNDADLGSLMQEISSQTGFNMVTYGDIRGNVNARIEKMPLEQALNLIFQGTNFTYKKIPGPDQEKPIFLLGDKSPNSPAALALTSSQLIRLQHIKAEGIPGYLPSTLAQANIKVIKEQNSLLITGTEDQVQQLREFIKQIDIVTPQVMIECLVVELSKRASTEIGFKGGFLKNDSAKLFYPRVALRYGGDKLNDLLDEIGGKLKYGSLGKLPSDFLATIDALEIAGKAKVRARPKITTLNGNQASINVGWVRYYQTSSQTPQGTITQLHSIDAGINLQIVPWVAASGEITTEIHPSISNLSGIGAGGLPEISRRTVDTTIRLKDGET